MVMSQKRHFMRGFKGKMPRPEVSRDVSCEPAQSKCPWTCHKSHFHPVSAFSATICKKYAAPQKLGARACADAMHMDMSQEQFNKKGAAPQSLAHVLYEPAVEMRTDMSQGPLYARIHRKTRGHKGHTPEHLP